MSYYVLAILSDIMKTVGGYTKFSIESQHCKVQNYEKNKENLAQSVKYLIFWETPLVPFPADKQ